MPKKLTQAEFIARAEAVHGAGAYDYSRAVYAGIDTKLIVICPKHGAWSQSPTLHLRGMMCRKCAADVNGAARRLTTDQFIAKATAQHGLGSYDYSLAVYITQREKVKILCPAHGIFEQNPNKHICGDGCPKCGVLKSAKNGADTFSEFIAKAHMKHGAGTYDYSQMVYLPNPQLLSIGCRIHGVFTQTAGEHIYGGGCPRCNRSKAGLAHRKPKAHQIAHFEAVHGKFYDYSKVPETFITKGESIPIICPVHGEFWQEAQVHRRGDGCRTCGVFRRASARRLTQADFIAKAEDTHGAGTYDYSQAVYAGNNRKVVILCPKHGLFKQVPASHFIGAGCPACGWAAIQAAAKLSWQTRAAGRECTLYFLRVYNTVESFFKVGITYLSVAKRYNKSVAQPGGYSYEVLAEHKSTNAAAVFDWEQSIIETFAHLRYKPLIKFDGETECFSSADEILAIFPL